MSGDLLKEQCKKACEQLKTWREARHRALAQLNSIHNLVGQLETLHQCSRGGVDPASDRGNLRLGVVREHPFCVQLLEAKLVQAMERAYSSALKEKRVLNEVVQKLKKYSKEGQKNFEDAVGHCGLEIVCQRTAESFSAADCLAWLNETHCSYRADLEEKLPVLDTLKYTTDCLEYVCAVWRTEPDNNGNGFDFLH